MVELQKAAVIRKRISKWDQTILHACITDIFELSLFTIFPRAIIFTYKKGMHVHAFKKIIGIKHLRLYAIVYFSPWMNNLYF